MKADHKVYQWVSDGRDCWECSCGASGSAPRGVGYLLSDRHIKPGETRVDTNRSFW